MGSPCRVLLQHCVLSEPLSVAHHRQAHLNKLASDQYSHSSFLYNKGFVRFSHALTLTSPLKMADGHGVVGRIR